MVKGLQETGLQKVLRLAGVEVLIAESIERIHRTNLVGMGVLPLQFKKVKQDILMQLMDLKHLISKVKSLQDVI